LGGIAWNIHPRKLMVTKRLKMLIAAVVLAALIAVIIYQQMRIGRFAAEAAVLREQIQQQASVQSEPQKPAKLQPGEEMRSNSAPSLTGEPFNQLLRLRGEVGVLRRQLAEVVAREASQQTQYQGMVKQVDSIKGDAAREMIRADIYESSEEKMLTIARNTLGDLASALDMPEAVSKRSSEEGLSDESLKRYRAYFIFKMGCEQMQMIAEPLRKPHASAE
jgi:hypothetical protein